VPCAEYRLVLRAVVIATRHVHVDDQHCLETLVVERTGTDINALVNRLRSLNGLEQVKFTVV